MRKRDLLILLLAIAVAVTVAVSVFSASVIRTMGWGLNFRTLPPTGSAGKDQLLKLDAAYLGDPEEKKLYLTFDAGYENGTTAKILDTLKAHDVKTAFFLAGHYLDKNADLVRRMQKEGHIVGNHTVSHPDITKLDDEALTREIQGLEDKYRQITGQEMEKYFRPPQGIFNEQALKKVQALGYRTVFWSLAYVDWNDDAQPTREETMEKLLSRTHNGAVILLHSTSKANAAYLDELLNKWEEAGYTFGTLEELFESLK